ncbi:hypothetical protein N018_12395 [Pseudomonas syringae CC1557]|uniref:Uncharacterized protein n=1 Tax=Pseudomonas syringae CC1557 TaxID=1357279 RepID=W0MYB6_PSESX|nr:hypothetical protein N018_12395 [Pseudomonas syringae CC1557]
MLLIATQAFAKETVEGEQMDSILHRVVAELYSITGMGDSESYSPKILIAHVWHQGKW